MKDIEKLRFELNKPLLVMKARKGFLACGYISVAACNTTDDVCAIVRGVNSYEEMCEAPVVAVSRKAGELGIRFGDTGEAALLKMM